MGSTIIQAVEKLDEIEKAMAGKELGEAIERLLEKEGWSQGDLGKKIGLHQSSVSRIISGEHGFPLETVYRLAIAFKISPFELAAIYWGIEVEQLSNKDKELLNNLLRLFDDYRKDVPPLLPPKSRPFEPSAQAYQGLKDAEDITDKREQPPPTENLPLPPPELEDEDQKH